MEITVGAKRTLSYVVEALAQLNRHPDDVVLRGVGQCITKATEVAYILSNKFDVKVDSAKVLQFRGKEPKNTRISAIDIPIHTPQSVGGARRSFSDGEPLHKKVRHEKSGFLSFPLYHLILSSLLYKNDVLLVAKVLKGNTTEYDDDLIRIHPTVNGFRCEGSERLKDQHRREVEDSKNARKRTPEEEKSDTHTSRDVVKITSALSRAGLILSDSWESVSNRLGNYDDIILGVDTNILIDCVLSQQLLDGFIMTGPRHHIYTPNWSLLIIPSAVMHEIEQIANSRDDRHGLLDRRGRSGYRALSEILELDQSNDMLGTSLLIVGEANPVLDTRVELRALREEMAQRDANKLRKSSAGDTIIRDQFKHLLRQIGFHKGAYFLTADKSNSALAQAEGLHTIYYPKPHPEEFKRRQLLVEPKSVFYDPSPTALTIPLGKVIYELAVGYGRVSVRAGSTSFQLACDDKGDSLDRWVNRDLRVSGCDLKNLFAEYGEAARFSLSNVEDMWEELNRHLMGAP